MKKKLVAILSIIVASITLGYLFIELALRFSSKQRITVIDRFEVMGSVRGLHPSSSSLPLSFKGARDKGGEVDNQ